MNFIHDVEDESFASIRDHWDKAEFDQEKLIRLPPTLECSDRERELIASAKSTVLVTRNGNDVLEDLGVPVRDPVRISLLDARGPGIKRSGFEQYWRDELPCPLPSKHPGVVRTAVAAMWPYPGCLHLRDADMAPRG